MQRQRGVSLIEAIVALAVVAVGLLGIVGLQTNMRFTSDVSKQRAEAVRIAQERIESRRAIWSLGVSPGVASFADITSTTAEDVTGIVTNTTFRISEEVAQGHDGLSKTLAVTVVWKDRTGEQRSVRLATVVSSLLPQVSAALVASNGGAFARFNDRHSAIPRDAVRLEDGTSRFDPAADGSLTWFFNNTTGLITRTCVGAVCTDVVARLLAGYVRFSTGAAPNTPSTLSMSELPTSTAFSLGVALDLTAPTVATLSCATRTAVSWVEYYCAVPIGDAAGLWSGGLRFTAASLATSVGEVSASMHRVCRYTSVAQNGSPLASQPTAYYTAWNAANPFRFGSVDRALVNQNFLVISAGDDATAYSTCPADDSSTPFVNGLTWPHQPV